VDFPGYQTTLLNATSQVTGNFSLYRKIIDPAKPMLVRLLDPLANHSTYVLIKKGKAESIIVSTAKGIQSLSYNPSFTRFAWVEEDYNLPPRLVCKEMGRQERVLYQSNRHDTAILSLKQEIISYTNSDRVPLKGILYYPLGYDPSRNYPMVVHIYQVQSNKQANRYPVAAYSQANNDGFNLRLLLEKGYFVYFPDIVYGQKGTGLSALDCVNHALDAVSSNVLIDKNKIGLIGHSHGGYETNFIATHSDRFAAYVSGAGNSDIVRSYFSFNYNFLSPFYWQYETGQYKMGKSFTEDRNLYFQNNPIYDVDQVTAPVLLWAGKKDQNIDWEQTMEFYIGLKRNNKKVVALFYPNEGHALMGTDACRDLVSRILDWFGYFLKGEETETGWIY
ncbi:MAG: alpha/beta hydrolase family protein, partial [Bacteroidales bacterium]